MENNDNQNTNIDNNKSDNLESSSALKKRDSAKINIYPHLRQNILDPSKNCKDSLEHAYYCITCKVSTCEKCTLNNHKTHKLVLKNDYINFDPSIFDETKKIIQETYNFENKEDELIKVMEDQVSLIHKIIDEVKGKKINEIRESFVNAKKNVKELIDFVDTVKQIIEKFYEDNKRFFNEKNNNDLDNTIFLMKYEFMTLCNNKNMELLKGVNELKKEFVKYEESIKPQGDKVIEEINNFLGLYKPRDKFDDYYWDVKFRIKTYNEHINKIQKGIYDIIQQSGDINDLQEIVNILDSKNKKGIQYVFNQDYFNNPQQPHDGRASLTKSNNNAKKYLNTTTKKDKNSDKLSENSDKNKKNPKKKKNTFIRLNKFNSSKKNKIRSQSTISSANKSEASLSRCDSLTRGKGHKRFGSPYVSGNKHTIYGDDIKYAMKKMGIKSYNDIILDDKAKQKYFTYSVIDLYNRLFMNQARKSFDTNARIFADYNERNSQLKEHIKPIPGTNEILYYNSSIDKSKKIKLNLTKKNHGYEKFPSGCRHLFIENKLYICGGVDEINMPMSICLVYNSATNTIQRIDDMCLPHAYHSMEYLDNYDCFLVIGGENNKCCELFDIFTNKWTRLPDLNVARANLNIYFDPFTSEIYALFGMIGTVSQKHVNNSEAIEVLELNDISSGWCKVDYYKGSSFDLRNEIVTTLPFTRNKLLIYGGKNVRDGGKLFGLFLIDRMEVIKADKDTIEKIKYEQKKIKLLNNTIAKTHSGK